MKILKRNKSKVNIVTDEKIVKEFLTRGVENVYPSFEDVEKRLKEGKRLTIYTGMDPTGDSLHLGHATVFRKLAKLQEMGHEIIVLIGDFTARIGDPTDKSATRTRLTVQDVKNNMKDYLNQLKPIINFNDKKNPVKVKYNSKWLASMSFKDVVDLASNFTVQQMLERDMFEKRMDEGKPIFLHEFLYPMMQGYDSVAMDVDMEIGGNDQTFNMLAGRTLEKTLLKKDKIVLTLELLVDDKGNKMSKTDNNFVALNNSPEDMFGKIMSWTDGMIINGFRLLTDVSSSELKNIDNELKTGVNPKDLKMKLAYEVVKLYKGEAGANKAKENFIQVFSKGAKPDNVKTVNASSTNILDALLEVGIVTSKGDARRVIDQKGLKVNGNVIDSYDYELNVGVSEVQKGKRHFVNIKIK